MRSRKDNMVTDLHGSRPTCSTELFLEYKIPRQQKCILFDGSSQSTNGRRVNVCCTHKVMVCLTVNTAAIRKYDVTSGIR